MSPSPATETPASSSASGGRKRRLREVVLPAILFVGDACSAVLGLVAGYGMRYHTPIREWGLPVPGSSLQLYLPLLLLGAAMLVGAWVYLGLYDPRLLLRRVYSLGLVMKGLAFWLLAYLGVSLVLKFDPPISRLFVLVAFGSTLVVTYAWRNAFYYAITRRGLLAHVKQRVVLLGADDRMRTFARELAGHPAHPFAVVGSVALGSTHASDETEVPALGAFADLESILRTHRVDLVVADTLELPRDQLAALIESCERTYTDWKIVPSAFDLFVSNLQLESHGGVPLLGVGPLAVSRLFHRAVKRSLDLAGAGLGLVLAAPVVLVSTFLIRRESPGPVLFRQIRVGAHHRSFTMLKLRTMHLGAEAEDDARQSTTADDPRVLRIGRILRRWNIDELPQLWNVLRGDMSLVGPRPERPYHVDQLSDRIRHYLPRHLVKPGMTGWAQISGCRGEGDLERRIQHDIYYIENWSLWLDLQIIVLTFLRWRAPE
jgi:exopolysaccharide biosynthesis polyprenyl glycosylphosphotransferase